MRCRRARRERFTRVRLRRDGWGTTQVTRPNSYHLCVRSQSLFRSDRKPYRATTHVPRNANTATATSNEPDPNLANNSQTVTTLTATQADVSVTKTAAAGPVLAGNSIAYTITVANAGPSDAQTVALSDLVPANTTFVSLTAPQGWMTQTPEPGGIGNVTARTPVMTNGGSATLMLVVNVNANAPADSTIGNTATVRSASVA